MGIPSNRDTWSSLVYYSRQVNVWPPSRAECLELHPTLVAFNWSWKVRSVRQMSSKHCMLILLHSISRPDIPILSSIHEILSRGNTMSLRPLITLVKISSPRFENKVQSSTSPFLTLGMILFPAPRAAPPPPPSRKSTWVRYIEGEWTNPRNGMF